MPRANGSSSRGRKAGRKSTWYRRRHSRSCPSLAAVKGKSTTPGRRPPAPRRCRADTSPAASGTTPAPSSTHARQQACHPTLPYSILQPRKLDRHCAPVSNVPLLSENLWQDDIVLLEYAPTMGDESPGIAEVVYRRYSQRTLVRF